jgi:serine/threonine protein kinase
VLDFLQPDESGEFLGQFDGYKVRECVGYGGMGIVLKAFDPALSRIVALKVLAPHLAANANARKRFLREARAAAAVSHVHVITLHAVSECSGLPYLVMEFIRGVSLQQKINAEGALELEEILRIGSQIASGLAAAHEQGLIHRDVKPGNILLENGVQRVKITDFGLARAGDDGGVTRYGMVIGTPAYMAPEQARGGPLDARADLFSLGSVLYAMCTGESPFGADSVTGTLRRVCDEQPRPIRQANPDLPAWLAAIIERLHAKSPQDRIQSAAEVAELLTAHLAAVQQGALSGGQTGRGSKASFSRSHWLISAGALLLAMMAVVSAKWIPAPSVPRETRPGPSEDATPASVVADDRHDASGAAGARQDAERKVAEWTLARNGALTLHQIGRIERSEELPREPFRVQTVALPNRGLTDRDLDRFRGLADLEGLELLGNRLTDDALVTLAEIRSLRWLYLGKTKIGDAELARLARLTELESLGLDGTRVTDAGLTQLRGLRSLRELLLANTGVTDATLAHLEAFPTLVRLDLFGARITDDGLQHLQALPQLKRLGLQQTDITDAGLERLAALTHLKELNLKQTQATAQGVAALSAALPECRVEH